MIPDLYSEDATKYNKDKNEIGKTTNKNRVTNMEQKDKVEKASLLQRKFNTKSKEPVPENVEFRLTDRRTKNFQAIDSITGFIITPKLAPSRDPRGESIGLIIERHKKKDDGFTTNGTKINSAQLDTTFMRPPTTTIISLGDERRKKPNDRIAITSTKVSNEYNDRENNEIALTSSSNIPTEDDKVLMTINNIIAANQKPVNIVLIYRTMTKTKRTNI